MTTRVILETQLKESAPLLERLDACMERVAKMCKEGRPPKMTIPVQWNDDDFYIINTIMEAIAVLRPLDEVLVTIAEGSEEKCKTCGRGGIYKYGEVKK